MNFWGWFFFAFVGLALGAILYSWWHKFVTNRPDKYGKGPGHDPRGPERMQWDRPDRPDRREGR